MRKNTVHDSFIDLLDRYDQQLLSLDIDSLKLQIYNASDMIQEGMWNSELMEYIVRVPLSDLPFLEWITEKYYAAKLRDPELQKYFDYFYLLGYIRVICLRLLYTQDMGYSKDDLFFVLMALKKHYADVAASTVNILEIGCGTGELLTVICNCGYSQIKGIDISPVTIRMAKDRFRQNHILPDRFWCISFEDFMCSSNAMSYDVIIHADVIEHIAPSDTLHFLKNIYHLLKPQGLMIVMTPSKLTGPHDSSRFFESPGAQPVGFHLREFLLSELNDVLLNAGFAHLETVSSLPSLNNYWDVLSEENFLHKLWLEKYLMHTNNDSKKSLIDGMYFKGVVCRKVP